MKISFNSTDLKNIFLTLSEKLDSKIFISGFEYKIDVPESAGDGEIIGFDFGGGFNMIRIKSDLFKMINLEFREEGYHILRYLFMANGNLIHSLSPSFRYRLLSYTSSIIARQSSQLSQDIILPAQNRCEVVMLQINTEKYSRNVNLESLNVPHELANVFLNKSTSDVFLYQSSYSVNIFETLKQLNNITSEGLVKRFYLESKALELLWMQTEHYKIEQLYGYDRALLRKRDIELILQAKDFIRNNIHENLTVGYLARTLGTNETKLKTGFVKLFGNTFGEVLRNERLVKAKILLEEGKMSVKEVAYNVGYTSRSVFARRFREKFGILPSLFQNN